MICAKRSVLSAMASLCGLVLSSGCLSDNPGSSSLAYVDIETHGPTAVRTATIRVFEDDGYTRVDSAKDMVFEREATHRDQVLFGQFGDDRLVMRVVVSIEPRRMGGCLVRADAYALHDGKADALPRMARRGYQQQLNRVKAGLVTSGAPVEGKR